jgi:hypothetical protein
VLSHEAEGEHQSLTLTLLYPHEALTGTAQARFSLSSFCYRTKLKGSVVISVPMDRAYVYITPFP